MKCFEINNIGYGFPIKLEQASRGKDKFKVSYGKHVDENLSYAAAAAKLGEAIMHALACSGKLDNER